MRAATEGAGWPYGLPVGHELQLPQDATAISGLSAASQAGFVEVDDPWWLTTSRSTSPIAVATADSTSGVPSPPPVRSPQIAASNPPKATRIASERAFSSWYWPLTATVPPPRT